MIAVIFEVWPADGRTQTYLDHAARLRDELTGVEGFISVERFQSLIEPGKLLSISFWRDEAAIADWRNREQHRATQAAGRSGMFTNYRIRVASVVRDYSLDERDEVPADSRARHDQKGA